MSDATPAPSTQATHCSACGAKVTGRFCGQCGTQVGGKRCVGCGAELSSGARFCHRCGAQVQAGVAPAKERRAWIAAGVAVLLTVAVVAYQVGKGEVPPPTVADMGNAGNGGARPVATPRAGVRAPDISQMSPRERFDRLWQRVMTAAEAQSSDTVMLFAPMALGAYSQLDSVDADARYHAALIHLAVGEFPQAKALADTIGRTEKNHLFAFMIRGEVAEQQNDQKTLTQAYHDFLANYDTQIAANRKEYADHKPILDDFKNRAAANQR